MAAIEPTPEYVEQLLSMVHSKKTLLDKGFALQPLKQAELLQKLRCVRCKKRVRKGKSWSRRPKNTEINNGVSSTFQGQGGLKVVAQNGQDDSKDPDNKPSKPTCQWHTGVLQRGRWNCCRVHMFAPGCHSADTHDMPSAVTPATVARHQLHLTPQRQANDTDSKAIAVAIDCEMGTASDGNSEVIRVTLIEYFSGAVLIDTLVWPDVPMEHYNTRWSGVSAGAMQKALRAGTCLVGGAAAARAAVWRWVDADTIVVGHSVQNDLTALRWAHGVVLDSMLIEESVRARERLERTEEEEDKGKEAELEAEGKQLAAQGDEEDAKGKRRKTTKPKEPGLSLKVVTKLRLGRDIQKGAHDSLEDALASRDIVHHHAVACEGGLDRAEEPPIKDHNSSMSVGVGIVVSPRPRAKGNRRRKRALGRVSQTTMDTI